MTKQTINFKRPINRTVPSFRTVYPSLTRRRNVRIAGERYHILGSRIDNSLVVRAKDGSEQVVFPVRDLTVSEQTHHS